MKANITATFYGVSPEVYKEIANKYDGTSRLREDGTYVVTINLFTSNDDEFINKAISGNNCFIGVNKL